MAVDPGSVRFATICDDTHGFTPTFLRSLLPTLGVDLGGEQRIWRGGYAIQHVSSAGVVEGRNSVVKEFLSSESEWLWFVDADMGWEPDALEQLMAAADPEERPIVGGLCFGFGPVDDRVDDGQGIPKIPFPTIFDIAETEDDVAFKVRYGYVPGEVQQCAATGAACLLVHRSVFERMTGQFGFGGWFDRMKPPGSRRLWGEDTSFCMRAGMVGIPVFVHGGVRTSHAKVMYATQTAFMQAVTAPPATDEVAVIVPVLGRPQNAEPFMQSLRASTGLATVYAVCNDGDEVSWIDAGATVVKTDGKSFAHKVNAALPMIDEPWLFLVGDDVKFHPGWLDHAQHVARLHNAKVIGTNDLGNERVTSGEHATHILIARDYIDQHGAGWDGPGVVCHEGYRHWYVDDEIVVAAKQRGVWAPALSAVVEHLHPIWGKAETDDTYRLGQSYAERDRKLFLKRLEEHQEVSV